MLWVGFLSSLPIKKTALTTERRRASYPKYRQSAVNKKSREAIILRKI